jgi:NitT/TauT family transport system substrate-binding protein
MKYFYLFTIFIALIFTSCSSEPQKVLKISTNSWIGYAPLFYAQEKGYLKEIEVTLLTNVSLAEAAELYNIGKADMVTTTQHEYYSLKKSNKSLVPIILFDRSDGGDIILSNRTIQELQKAQRITAYLEIDSINAEVLTEFMKKYHINSNKIDFINKDQAQIEEIQNDATQNIIIVTYAPYNIKLLQNRFTEVASTKDENTLLVIDALCTSREFLEQNKEKLKKLKKIIDRSIQEIMRDKKTSYKLIKNYFGNISYDNYINSLNLIVWINRPSEKILEKIKTIGYDKRWLIQ